jgi:zinc-finger of transposase IS204/IS1001/IS1096/IS1165
VSRMGSTCPSLHLRQSADSRFIRKVSAKGGEAGRKKKMKSLLYHGFGIKGYRYLRTRYEKGEIVFELEPENEPEVPAGQKLRRHGYRWRTVRSVSIGLKPVVLKVKVPRWLNTTTGEEFEQNPPLSKPTRKSRVRSGD